MTEKVLICLGPTLPKRGNPFDRSGRDSLMALEHVDSILAVWPGDLGLSARPKNWVAAMTYLERKYPNEFALRTVNRNLNSTDQPIGDKVDEEQLRRYAAQMEGFQARDICISPASESNPRIKVALSPEEDLPAFGFSNLVAVLRQQARQDPRFSFGLSLLSCSAVETCTRRDSNTQPSDP